MTPKEKLAEIIAANKARQARARALNVRAGEKLFPVLSREALAEWLAPRLAGARNAREVHSIEALRLEPLDEALAAKVETENPLELALAEVGTFAVQYRDGYAPQLDLPADAGWQHLPDEGVRLPGGREVAVKVVWDSWYSTGPKPDLAELKSACAERQAAKDFDAWQKPAIEIPDLTVEGAAVPDLREEVFGHHALSDQPLIAFGVVVCDYYGRFGAAWSRNREEAEAARKTAVAKAAALQAETRRKREEAEAKEREAAEAAKREAEEAARRAAEEEAARLAAAAEAELAEAFAAWQPPTLELPDLAVEGAKVPEVVEAEFARLANGTAVLAFGALRLVDYTTELEWRWSRDREQAKYDRNKVVGHAAALQAETRRKREEAEEEERKRNTSATLDAATLGALFGGNARLG